LTPRLVRAGEFAFAALAVPRGLTELQDPRQIAMEHSIKALALRPRRQHLLLDQLAQALGGLVAEPG